MRLRDASGQTTAEYAALLALVGALLAGAGAAVGLGSVGDAVASTVRTGICIVAGDICRSSDARALGLEPCTVGDRTEGGGMTVSVAWLRLGRSDRWTVASRSDGSVVVTRLGATSAGAGLGLGVTASPLGLELGVKGVLDLTFGSGAAWEFPDTAAAARFLAREDRDDVPPTWRFGEAGDTLKGAAGAKAGGVTLTGVELTADRAAGVRVGRGLRTVYVRTRLATMASAWVPGRTVRWHGPTTGAVVTELTSDAGGLREIAFRSVRPGARGGQVVETVARLDLRDRANRARAERLLRHRLPWPGAVAGELRALLRHTVQTGTVERAVYDVRDDSGAFEMATRLGLQLGFKSEQVDVQRRLVAASAWTPGSVRERLREDCAL